jgi:The ARF-like 2 binding protein BART
MAELGVTQEQFIEACEKASLNPLHKKIVDQITAVDNFVAFKKLMVKRNTELNEQAMKMIHGGGA